MDVFFMAVTGILAAFGLLAMTWGVDSRDYSTDPHRPEYPVSLSI
ncbi:MAG TPA: hypothetical protein VFK54_02005 [Candidatus Limnocylindrales bacterium]|nr:hypothetical protein [Candidatus Limnocylindrales bacterium]